MPVRTMIALAGAALGTAANAQLDNNVQWQGVSHLTDHDLAPRVPMNGQAFTVRFQTFAGDISSARVRYDTGSVGFASASIVSTRGPYDIWEATVPATASGLVSYVLEITDGTDTDYYNAAGMTDGLVTTNPFEIDFVTLDHAPAGATPVAGGTVFKVWSPANSTCDVRGEFNGWSTGDSLTKVGDHFVGFVPGANPQQMYKYFFDGQHWHSDPRAARLNPTDSYNAYIVDQDLYPWQVNDFSPAPLEELVIYQLHVGTFAGRNDPFGFAPNPSRYVDVAARAQHLADLGVNAVMLNPIHEFPGDFSGGYMSISPFAIESKLGTPYTFKSMVDALHQAGIAVLLDIVPNHASISDNILWDFGGSQQYFDTPPQDTPWGSQCDLDEPGVFDMYLDSWEAMLTEYRLDGFRMDAVMYMTDSNLTSQWGAGQELVRALHDRMTNRHADKHSIAEIYIDNRWVTDPTTSGLGFDAQYHNEFKEAVRSAVFGAAFNNASMQRVANVLDGQGFGVSGQSVFNYFELHDDAWPLNGHERAVTQIDTTFPNDDDFARGRTIVGNALALLSRGVPAILQGTEWLENDGWEASKIDWSHKTDYAGIVRFYSDLIALRTTEPALFANSPLSAFHVNDALDVMAFERFQVGGGSFVAVVNLSNSDRNGYRIGIPRDGNWDVVINSSDTQYDGPGGGTPAGPVTIEPVASGPHPRSVVLDLPARSIMLLQHEAPADCPADVNGDGVVSPADFNAWIIAFNNQLPECDQNGDSLCAPADFNAWIINFNTGCP
ncbi:MAG: alpha-amylase family glycosyl hydrolase [Planctomycetota bacterium]|jgi:1,4-alpha-glucan branching enzyme